jgi:starch synthase (maltosyl-transferring)
MAGLRFYAADSAHVLFYGKLTPARDNVILVAINLDPFAIHEATLQIPLAEIGIAPDETYELHELLGGDRRLVRGATHAVTLDPRVAPAHIYRVGRWRRRERDFDYYA